jgi:stage V sporulation protein AA
MEIIYIKLEPSSKLFKKNVYLGDVAQVWSPSRDLEERCKKLEVLSLEGKKGEREVLSIIKIVKKIKEEFPNCEIESFGEADGVIIYEEEKKEKRWLSFFKTAFVCIISFVGAAFAIMTFNNDGDVTNIFDKLTFLLTGEQVEGMSVMKASYMVGLPIGILVFFNHFSKVKVSQDPTPIEVQMQLYRDDICKTLIANEGGKENDD